MELDSLLARAQRIALWSSYLARSQYAGLYRSAFRGLGVEFADVRLYEEGDDIRLIDWNVSARTQTLHVKRMQEERDRHLLLVLDTSGSLRFGSVARTKHDLLVEAAALLVLSGFYAKDRASLALVSTAVDRYIPAAKGWIHATRLIREMMAHGTRAEPQVTMEAVWAFLNSPGVPRSLVLLLTDYQAPLSQHGGLAAACRKHEVVAVLASDPREWELPPVGRIRARDPETGITRIINTDRRSVRDGFRQRAEMRRQEIRDLLKSMRADLLEISTDAGVDIALRRFFQARIARRGCRRP